MHLSRMPENKCVLQQASQEVPQIFAACTLQPLFSYLTGDLDKRTKQVSISQGTPNLT